MSGITSVVEPIFSGIARGVGSVAENIITSAPRDMLSDRQLKQQQAQREAQLAASNAARAQELTDAANQQITRRNETLRRGLSRARTYFAAQGIDPNSGSAEALAESQSSDTQDQNNETLSRLDANIQDMNRSLSNLQSNDLLERTQRRQRTLWNRFL